MSGEAPAAYKLLYFYRGEAGASNPFASTLEQRGWQIEQVPVSDFARFWGVWEVFRRRDFASYDVAAATEYYLSWALCLRLLLSRTNPKVVALGFNQSRRLLLTGLRPIDGLLNRIWRRACLFLVHSKAEARLFADLHDIPEERFVFSHWGYDLPAHDASKTKVPSEPYVTMVGRNNRDIATFSAAVERAGVKGVLITAGYILSEFPVERSNDVILLADRPMEECLNYVAGSFAHLVLVVDASRGAGHISAVSAMLLGKPQIFSDVAPLRDYLVDDFNGIAVPAGDTDAVVNAIRRLRDDPELSERLGLTGRAFALEHMSHAVSTRRMAETIVAAVEDSTELKSAAVDL